MSNKVITQAIINTFNTLQHSETLNLYLIRIKLYFITIENKNVAVIGKVRFIQLLNGKLSFTFIDKSIK